MKTDIIKSKHFVWLLGTLLLFSSVSFSQDTTWVKNNTWYFDNFTKPVLPWTLFRETFTGVAPTPSGDFDQFFYNGIYKTELASEGLCFGMCVMALTMKKNGGYLGFCYPPCQYSGTIFTGAVDSIGPADPNLKTAIIIEHGNQINHGFLSFLLDVIAIGKNKDGLYACSQVNYYLAKDDPPVISITKGLSPADGGHVLIPYFTKPIGDSIMIYVYDPNRSYYGTGADGKDWYKNYKNYISVYAGMNPTKKGDWNFNFKGNELWWGSPNSIYGGNLIVIPLSVAGKKDRLPQSLFAEGAYALNKIFIFANNQNELDTNKFFEQNKFNNESTNKKGSDKYIPFMLMRKEDNSKTEGQIHQR